MRYNESTSKLYNCGWDCKRYNSLCDACDSYMGDFEEGKTKKEIKAAWKKANKGISPHYFKIKKDSDLNPKQKLIKEIKRIQKPTTQLQQWEIGYGAACGKILQLIEEILP